MNGPKFSFCKVKEGDKKLKMRENEVDRGTGRGRGEGRRRGRGFPREKRKNFFNKLSAQDERTQPKGRI